MFQRNDHCDIQRLVLIWLWNNGITMRFELLSCKICSYSCLSIGPWNWQREVFSFLGFFYAWEDNIFIREWVIGLCPFLSTNHPFIQIGQWRNQFINNGWRSKTLACNYKRFKRCSNFAYCPQIWICFNCLCLSLPWQPLFAFGKTKMA